MPTHKKPSIPLNILRWKPVREKKLCKPVTQMFEYAI